MLELLGVGMTVIVVFFLTQKFDVVTLKKPIITPHDLHKLKKLGFEVTGIIRGFAPPPSPFRDEIWKSPDGRVKVRDIMKKIDQQWKSFYIFAHMRKEETVIRVWNGLIYFCIGFKDNPDSYWVRVMPAEEFASLNPKTQIGIALYELLVDIQFEQLPNTSTQEMNREKAKQLLGWNWDQ